MEISLGGQLNVLELIVVTVAQLNILNPLNCAL